MAAPDDYATYLTAAQTAFAGGDYVTARRQVALAAMSLAQMPNAGSDTANIAYRQNELDRIMAAIREEIGDVAPLSVAFSEMVSG